MKLDFISAVHNKQTQPLNFEVLNALCDSPQVINVAQGLRNGTVDSKAKKNLPAITWQAWFEPNERNDKNAQLNGLFAADFDHMADPDQIWKEHVEPKIEQLDIVIAHKSISGNGLHLVALCQEQFDTILDNQIWLAEQLGLEQYLDRSCHDFARCMIVAPKGYWYFINEEIFSYES